MNLHPFATAALLVIISTFVLWVALSYWPRPRKTIRQLHLRRFFHGMVLFGKEGSYVQIKAPSSAGTIVFKKRSIPNGWSLRVEIHSDRITAGLSDQILSRLEALRPRFETVPVETSDGSCVAFALLGKGLDDPDGLEGVATGILDSLGFSRRTRFRVDFKGPKDYVKVNRYFGFSR